MKTQAGSFRFQANHTKPPPKGTLNQPIYNDNFLPIIVIFCFISDPLAETVSKITGNISIIIT